VKRHHPATIDLPLSDASNSQRPGRAERKTSRNFCPVNFVGLRKKFVDGISVWQVAVTSLEIVLKANGRASIAWMDVLLGFDAR